MAGRARPILDGQFYFLLGLLLALALLTWLRGGSSLLHSGLAGGLDLLVRYGAVLVVSFLAAGLVQELIPREWIQASLGRGSGLRGILLGTAAGMITPAGPFVSLPIAAVLIRSGAALPAVVAFLTGWALLAVHRLVAWEVPILGLRVALLRYGLSLLLPVLAGLLAHLLVRE
jgi:uncharacterized membrane protein YraQ (UPF0718 family)